MALRTPLLLSCITLALLGCAGNDHPAPPRTQQVDLQRYQGTWYELARLPMFFQRNCVQSEAHYGLRPDGRIDVTNRCKEKDGQWNEAKGVAEAQQPGSTDKLWVRFDNWFSRLAPGLTKGEYWVLYHDKDYRVAMVGHPNREYLWLLSRTPAVPDQQREQLLSIAREQGYDTSKLIWRQAD
ncbi:MULTISPECIES: lipocalin family protein [unclassified Pseudomonas]|uniref:lipocalin family protein n=1 Tax=unclassified Pseudomonas TaxID=196821 RepID=UPI000D9016AC|nr:MULTISPECIES: lipocalin family protein [unclassified Pseudomonas]PYG81024.1 apolipoprotein D and lipocalin family protein [Pseudomonas sp. RV120224-01c]PYG84607.1 apolipoprotein D and lipocalin family protein [Pseudomonas sp. RV120224-01b]